jgi:uncharacterized protein YjiS (DUF1127 family)
MTMYPFTATPPAIPARWTASRYRPATSIGNALMVILKAVLDVLVEAQDRARRHNDLATLDDRILADVGLSRHEADHATKWLIK